METAVILAAGRGSRMGDLTDQRPKCLLELAGKPLLSWQLAALERAGITDVSVVRGYRGETLSGPFATFDNPRWAQTNMVRTLLCAAPVLSVRPAIVAYADIVYRAAHVRRLAACGEDLALTYDTEWETLWRLRFGDPLADAETFEERDGLVRTIGGRPAAMDQIRGQYMGLIKMTPAGFARIREFVAGLSPARGDGLDMTALLSGLLAEGVRVGAVPVCGGWLEADNPDDIARYEHALTAPGFSHDFRADSMRDEN